jgi:hypothetical protein
VYAHPSVVSHLKSLLNMIMSYGHVPTKFGSGIIVSNCKGIFADVEIRITTEALLYAM